MYYESIFPWFQFGFALSFGVLMYDEFEKKENKILIKKKMNYHIQ